MMSKRAGLGRRTGTCDGNGGVWWSLNDEQGGELGRPKYYDGQLDVGEFVIRIGSQRFTHVGSSSSSRVVMARPSAKAMTST
jgi:hypothetical protein